MLFIVLALSGCLTGITAVLFGFGGGFVIVPLLYRLIVLTYPAGSAQAEAAMHIAVATSTCVMIVNALAATRKHHRQGNILWTHVFPLAWFIAAGAALGAWAASAAAGDVVRIAFVVYIAVTIADCLLRRGFLKQDASVAARRLSGGNAVAGGLVIGAIATFLGVGGSVMTVPLMRRLGLPMKNAVAMANPLSVPVAVAGSATYILMAVWSPPSLPAEYLGYINVPAFAILSIASIVGVRLAAPFSHRIPDRIHAWIYIGLLTVVLIAMAIR